MRFALDIKMNSLFENDKDTKDAKNKSKAKVIKTTTPTSDYSASDIKVLEGLEPVRLRPGMYIGSTDNAGLHHLVAEILDNSMDEAVAGFASEIKVNFTHDNVIIIEDDGRGIPVDEHPQYPGKSALEVIFTTLHSGGKFAQGAYSTSGGLHGVGVSVVNALSEYTIVEVFKDGKKYKIEFNRGETNGTLQEIPGEGRKNNGSRITFKPDSQIFENASFNAKTLFTMCRSKAYLHKGITIEWQTEEELIKENDNIPQATTLHYPKGLVDFLEAETQNKELVTSIFAGESEFPQSQGKVEWAILWLDMNDGFSKTFCNTIPTPLGGTHDTGLRYALLKALRAYGELLGNKAISKVTADDVIGSACIVLSAFIPDPQFQGQTKEKLGTGSATRLVENAMRDAFDNWLITNKENSQELLNLVIERAESRLRRRDQRAIKRQSATRRLRLPGKLADCSSNSNINTEIFIVEGDSAGGSAKQARDRKLQAILPLRGKILNVASASNDKKTANQIINDISEALGCNRGEFFDIKNLRYERIIIMTDADVDGAHIASLLLTFFYTEMKGILEAGRLYLAQPPLYRITAGTKSLYARDDEHKDELLAKEFKNRKVDISRFKGLGEMPPAQLKSTTMSQANRTLIKLQLVKPEHTYNEETQQSSLFDENADIIYRLMGNKPEYRMQFIEENAKFAENLDI